MERITRNHYLLIFTITILHHGRAQRIMRSSREDPEE